MGNLTFILGGARSGKSGLAQRLAKEQAGENVLYVATLRETPETLADPEMNERIIRHRASRSSAWHTLVLGEHPLQELAQTIAQRTPKPTVLLDCLSMLISGQLFMGEALPIDAEGEAARLVQALVALQQHSDTDWIVVSNEVGLSVVPETASGRLYRDALGRANQVLAHSADRVYFVIAGIVQQIKGAS